MPEPKTASEGDPERTSSVYAGPLSEGAVRGRSAAAVFYVVSWGFANLLITFFGSLVLARLLTPRDFGLIALGQTIATLAGTASEGGIASGFVRQSQGIPHMVLRAINGVQLIITLVVASLVTLIGIQFGLAGSLSALIIWSLPISSLQTGGRVVLLRELRFRDIAIIEALGVLLYYGWSVAGVVAGFGVWSLATGLLVRAVGSTLAVGGIVGWRLVTPSLRMYRDVLGVIGFGIRFSLNMVTNVLYEQAKNVVIMLLGGASALGFWALASRILQIPNLMYQPIHQIAFPAFSQFIASGKDPRPVLERVASLSFAASCLTLPAFLVFVPGMITTLFGDKWNDATLILPGVVLAIFIAAPVAAPCIQFLYAVGKPSAVLRVTLLAVLTNLAAITVLYGPIGLAAIGFGTVPGAAIESILLARLVRKLNGSRMFATMPGFLIASLLAVGVGFAVTAVIPHDGAAAAVGALTAVATATAACLVGRRSVLADLLRFGQESVSRALGEGR